MGGLNSNSHLPSSITNLQSADNILAAAGLPASLAGLNSSAIAELAASAAASVAGGAHQTQAHGASGRSSIQSAHHRSSNHHHQNHHPSATHLTAAHQSTSGGKAHLSAAHNQSQNTIHHRHSTLSNHNNNINNNNINKNIMNNNMNNNSNNNISNNSLNNNNLNNINTNIVNSINHINNTTTNNNSIINNNNNTITNANGISIIATNETSSITPPKASTCYKIGDCVYFDLAREPDMPLQIGRIEEICKTNNGDNIEVKVVTFFRRSDISSSLMTLADKYQYDEIQEEELKSLDKESLKKRELFYSRTVETIPATSIRGKCVVQLLNESESLASYLEKDDYYFYTLVYDPHQKTITADKGEIRVGQRYQAEVTPQPIYTQQSAGDPADTRDLNEMETLLYTPEHNLTDDDINKFLTIAKSVGTFARALDCSTSIKQPSLHLTAASASRDVTLLYAMQLLHQNNYDLGKAVCALVPSTGPVLCRDEIEEWTAGEATLFEEAIEKYGREFGDIRQDFVSI